MSWRDELLRRFPALQNLPPNSVVVGGAIRDLILGREPADVDVECAGAESVAKSVGKVIPLGRGEMRVFRVVRGDRVYDFSEPTELGRRDFTMNAMSLDLASGDVRDPFDGEEDARRGLLRMIRAENFQDDPLRILRGVRLALQDDFKIEDRTMAAMRRRAAHVTTVAAERVSYELDVIFSAGKFRRAVQLLNESGLDEPLFGYTLDANAFHSDDVSCAGAFALILREPSQFADRWKWSRELLRKVVGFQRLLRDPNLLAIFEADARELPSLFKAVGRPAPPMPDFATRPLLDGDEIGKLTGAEGPRLGALKRALIEAQLKGEVRTKDEAIAFVLTASK